MSTELIIRETQSGKSDGSDGSDGPVPTHRHTDTPTRPFRLGCAVPWPEDGTSAVRAMGPLWAMVRQGGKKRSDGVTEYRSDGETDKDTDTPTHRHTDTYPQLELVPPRWKDEGWQLSWDWVAACDAVFIQRPATFHYVQLAKLVKAMGRPLWIEWDDDYMTVPVSNASFATYNPQELRPLFKELCWLADVITVATPELGRRLPRVAQGKTIVIPNACMPVYRSRNSEVRNEKGQLLPFFNDKRVKRVSWRGTDTHDEDVATVLPALAELSRLPQFHDWFWHFSGGMPWQVHDAIPKERLEQSPFCGPIFFVPMLAAFAPFVHYVPLKRNAFNMCKSNIAWIEATCAGAVVLAPEGEEWVRPGVVTYTDRHDFYNKLRELMEQWDGGKLHPNVAVSRKYIEENLLLEKVNELRWEVLRGLMGKAG